MNFQLNNNPNMRQTILEECELIIRHSNNNKSYRNITKMLNRSIFTIQYIIKHHKEENCLKKKVKLKPRKKFTETEKR